MASTVVQLKNMLFAEERQILCPFDKRECLSLKQAACVAGSFVIRRERQQRLPSKPDGRKSFTVPFNDPKTIFPKRPETD